MHSAIENVIRNAVRYTGPGNSVDVLLESANDATPGFARLSVRDYGQGVPEFELANIFQPFYRVADDRNRESGGTGLGLAIADRVIRIHGGTIKARNAAPHGLEVEIPSPSYGVAQFTEIVKESSAVNVLVAASTARKVTVYASGVVPVAALPLVAGALELGSTAARHHPAQSESTHENRKHRQRAPPPPDSKAKKTRQHSRRAQRTRGDPPKHPSRQSFRQRS